MEDVIIVDFIFYEFKVDHIVLNRKIKGVEAGGDLRYAYSSMVV